MKRRPGGRTEGTLPDKELPARLRIWSSVRLEGKPGGKGPERELYCKKMARRWSRLENEDGMVPLSALERRLSFRSSERAPNRSEMAPARRSRGRRSSTTRSSPPAPAAEQTTPRHEQGADGDAGSHPARAPKGSSRERRNSISASISAALSGELCCVSPAAAEPRNDRMNRRKSRTIGAMAAAASVPRSLAECL